MRRLSLLITMLMVLAVFATACRSEPEELPPLPTAAERAAEPPPPPVPSTATPEGGAAAATALPEAATPAEGAAATAVTAGAAATPEAAAAPSATPTVPAVVDLAAASLFAQPGVMLIQVAPLVAARADLPAGSAYLGAAPNGSWLALGDAAGLHLLDVAAARVFPLPDYSNVTWIAWSPDSSRLTLVADERLVGITLAGGVPAATVLATAVDDRPVSVHWSPDSQSLVFICAADLTALCSVRADGSAGPQIVFDGSMIQPLREPRWSPDGDQIAFLAQDNTGVAQLFRINRDGSDPAQMTAGDFAVVAHRWSPAGDGHLVVRRSDSLVDLALVSVDGMVHSLFAEATAAVNDLVATWLPNGQQIGVFYTRGAGAAVLSVARIDVESGERTVLAEDVRFASWAPDGRYLALLTPGDQLQVIDTASGALLEESACTADCWQLAWLP